MAKPRGAVCNLICTYCYFLDKASLYPGSDFQMDDDLLERYTHQYIESQAGSEVIFAWQGGEPTLVGLDFYRKALAYQEKYRKPGMRITNTLQTNGTLLDEVWCMFFKQHGFLVGISIDGPAHLHDVYRLDRGGAPTYERVHEGLELLQAHAVDFNILCTVHAANENHAQEVYRFLRDDLQAEVIQFIPIVERAASAGGRTGSVASNRSVSPAGYGRFLIEVFDEWVRHDVGRVYVQLFDVALGLWLTGHSSLCVFAETCGAALALEHNGDLYSCDHFVEPDHLLGNICHAHLIDLAASEQQQRFGEAKHDRLPACCHACPVRFACNGGCPKNRISTTSGGEPNLNYLCPSYRAFFLHIDPAMRYMAAQLRRRQSPAMVMDWMASHHEV